MFKYFFLAQQIMDVVEFCGCRFIDFYYCCCKNESIIMSCWGIELFANCWMSVYCLWWMFFGFCCAEYFVLLKCKIVFFFLLETFFLNIKHTHTVSIFVASNNFYGRKDCFDLSGNFNCQRYRRCKCEAVKSFGYNSFTKMTTFSACWFFSCTNSKLFTTLLIELQIFK